MPETTEATICVVEDDQSVANLVARIAAKTGLHVAVFTSPQSILDEANTSRITLVIADVNMPEVSGPQLIEQLRANGLTCPVLFISGDSSIGTVDESLRVKGASFLPKPFTPDELTEAIWMALKQR